MLDFEGNVPQPYRRSNDRVLFKNENENEHVMSELTSTIASVTISNW